MDIFSPVTEAGGFVLDTETGRFLLVDSVDEDTIRLAYANPGGELASYRVLFEGFFYISDKHRKRFLQVPPQMVVAMAKNESNRELRSLIQYTDNKFLDMLTKSTAE